MRVYLGANNIISPLGFSTPENAGAVLAGEIALKKEKLDFSPDEFCCALMNDQLLEEKFAVLAKDLHYTKLEKMCVLAIDSVLRESDIHMNNLDSLLIISTTKGNIDLLEKDNHPDRPKGEYLSTMATTLGTHFKCKNTPLVVSNACISGLLAMIIAKRLIENEQYSNIVVCGADLVTEFTLSGFRSFNALSSEPCKPFDANRTGINLGECAAALLLSCEKISDIVISSGASANDANHISGPSRTGDGLLKALQETMAGTTAKPDFISAHGTATIYNDEMESEAFHRAHLHELPVNSLKGYYGHTLGAAGILESIIAIESLLQNRLFRSEGYKEQGTAHLSNIIQEHSERELRSCLKTASGFGGCNAAAIFEKV